MSRRSRTSPKALIGRFERLIEMVGDPEEKKVLVAAFKNEVAAKQNLPAAWVPPQTKLVRNYVDEKGNWKAEYEEVPAHEIPAGPEVLARELDKYAALDRQARYDALLEWLHGTPTFEELVGSGSSVGDVVAEVDWGKRLYNMYRYNSLPPRPFVASLAAARAFMAQYAGNEYTKIRQAERKYNLPQLGVKWELLSLSPSKSRSKTRSRSRSKTRSRSRSKTRSRSRSKTRSRSRSRTRSKPLPRSRCRQDGCVRGKVRSPVSKRCIAIGGRLYKTVCFKPPQGCKSDRQRCPAGKVVNPYTNRCITRGGRVYKQVCAELAER